MNEQRATDAAQTNHDAAPEQTATSDQAEPKAPMDTRDLRDAQAASDRKRRTERRDRQGRAGRAGPDIREAADRGSANRCP